MKKILVNYLGRKSGTAMYSYEMTKGLIENGAIVYAIISEQNTILDEWKKLGLQGLCVYPTYNSLWSFIKSTIRFLILGRKELKKICETWDIDVVYVPAFHLWSELVNRLFPTAHKIITNHDVLPHSGNIFKNKIIWYYNFISLKKADDIVILSKQFSDVIKKRTGLDNNHIHVIPHGCFSLYERIYNLKRYDYGNHKVNFLFFGRIEPYKGLNVLGEAYKRILCDGYDVSLTIVGNGDFSLYSHTFKDLKNVNIINRWIKDEEVLSFFQEDNIVTVLPYLDGTQSGVINIAMKHSSLVVASNVGGIKEQIKNMETGILVESNDVDSLYNAMKFTLNDNCEIGRMKQNALREMRELSWDKLSKKILDIIP
ncbi:glycosyltransferase family 4 protein [Selenomonas ruminantium]|uniref:Glycosyltransferase involved in cell wall bisynthesis n=1 Tax=Selenomonas ruminantium TaxID=971 RepID=A0A1H0NYI9_SELRU|nr:glycosyltransferase family 4 protein [Selenomonas ruminantium]SDO97495.1 Glycosyltransferase involved in cell wall bisynthesis [Selenomonas ruminantium]